MGGSWDNVAMSTRIPVGILEDFRIRRDKMEYENKVEVVNELSEFEYYHEEYELVNHFESCLIEARFLMTWGRRAEANEVLDNALRCY